VIGSITERSGTTSKHNCICPQNKYKEIQPDKTTFKCVDIPLGVNTTFLGLNRTNLFLQPGFYRVTKSSTEIMSCPNEDACVGGSGVGDGLCAEGTTGKLCSVCEVNYASFGVGETKTCVKCEGSATATIVIMVTIIAIVLFLSFNHIVREYRGLNTHMNDSEVSSLARTIAMGESEEEDFYRVRKKSSDISHINNDNSGSRASETSRER